MTMALARDSASARSSGLPRCAFAPASTSSGVARSFMKIPEPTKTDWAPSCIMSAASAGVAMPPAEKFGTGRCPPLPTPRTRPQGRPRVFPRARADPPQRLAEIAAPADERHLEGELVDVEMLIGRREHFRLVDEIHAE